LSHWASTAKSGTLLLPISTGLPSVQAGAFSGSWRFAFGVAGDQALRRACPRYLGSMRHRMNQPKPPVSGLAASRFSRRRWPSDKGGCRFRGGGQMAVREVDELGQSRSSRMWQATSRPSLVLLIPLSRQLLNDERARRPRSATLALLWCDRVLGSVRSGRSRA